MEICKYCGGELQEGEEYCQQCGKRVVIEKKTPEQIRMEQYNSMVERQNEKNANTTKWIITIGVVVGLIAVFAFVLWPYLQYKGACTNLEYEYYEIAYEQFVEMGDYKDSAQKADECMYAWAEIILEDIMTEDVQAFVDTVKVEQRHYATLYTYVVNAMNENTDWEYWCDVRALKMCTFLKVLPSSYEEMSFCIKFFEILRSGRTGIEESIREDKSFWRNAQKYELVQGLISSDDYIKFFLEGDWRASGSNYHITFYENSEGGISCKYNLPRPKSPANAKYYDIQNGVFVWLDENSKVIMNVYRIDIIDGNEIEVFCYQNNRTYKLTR